MRIPKRPTEHALVLPSHADMDQPPVFYFRPLTDEEEALFMTRLLDTSQAALPDGLDLDTITEDEALELLRDAGVDMGVMTRVLLDTFDRHLVRISGLEIGDEAHAEPFDRERHLGEIPGSWKLNLGQQITARARNPLSLAAEGNSSLPSSSAGTAPSTGAAPLDAAPSA